MKLPSWRSALVIQACLVLACSSNTVNAANFIHQPPSLKSMQSIELARSIARKRPINKKIYYDYLEDGQLRGGSFEVDQKTLEQFFEKGASTDAPTPPPYASTSIRRSGNASNRIDLVIVGDGYQSSELTSFANDAKRASDKFFEDEILSEYHDYFNVSRVDVISNDSGVDNDPSLGVNKDTALDMGFFCFNIERLLCIDTNKAWVAASNAPAVDQVLAIGNSNKYGGAGYLGFRISTASSDNNDSLEIAVHEFGHTFGELADEYGGTGTYSGSEPVEPNVSKLNASRLNNESKKWYRWLGTQGVSAFEGGRYNDAGIYRPTSNSIMRTLGQPWGAVNTEQMISKIYQTVKPVDSFQPAGTNLKRNATYTVVPLTPVGRALTIQWWLDDVLVRTGGAQFNGTELPNDNLPHKLAVRVVDQTNKIRDETIRQGFMTFEHIWSSSAMPSASGNNRPSASGNNRPTVIAPTMLILDDD